MLQHESLFHSFSWLNNIPLYRQTTFLFIHSLVNGHLGYFHFLAIMNNAAVNILVQVFVLTHGFNSLRLKLLDHDITLCLTF